MKNTWKRTIAILLSVLLAFTALPMALAAAGTAGTSVNYELDSNGVMKITGSGAMTSFASAADVPWNADKASIKQLIVSNGVTSIGAYAFSGCTALIDVSLPTGLAKIENNAFEGCTSLRIVTIPNTTAEIGAFAFNNCTVLETISILCTTCNIANAGTTIAPSAKIYGYPDSTAETYAKTYGRTFVSLGSGTQQVENDPAAVTDGGSKGTLDQILKTVTTYIQPLLTMFKNLFAQLLGNLGNSGSDSTSTTGSGGTTNSGTASAAGDASNVLKGILNSFMAFVNSTLANMNSGSTATTGTGTTASTGTTAAASTGGFDLSTLLGLLGKVDLSGLLNSATTTTAAAK